MKKMIALLLSLCLLLSGCGTVKSGETEPSPETDSTAPETLPETTPTEPEKTAYIPGNTDFDWKNDYYQYSNMQGGVSNFLYYDGQVIFFRYINQCVYSFDLTTGEVRRFCAKDGCDHSGDDCVYIKWISGSLEQYGGTLYGIDKYVVKGLRDGKWEQLANKYLGDFWHAEGDLYLVDREKVLYVCRGGTGEPEPLMEDYDYYWNMVFDGYLYSSNYRELVRVDLNAETLNKELLLTNVAFRIDGNHIYYTDEDNYLYRCKMDGTNSALLFDQPILPASMNFDDEYFYFRPYNDKRYLDYGEGSNDVYRLTKSNPSQIESIATLEEAVYQIFTVPQTGKIFVITYTWGKGSGEPFYVMNTDGSNVTKIEFPNS